MEEEELILRLENGNTTIKALWSTTNITYAKELRIKGMQGPRTVISKTEVHGAGFKNTMTYINPSPVEIDLGTVLHEIRNSKGQKIAEQKGKVYFVHGESTYVMTGTSTGVEAEGEATLVGIGVEEDNWNNLTIVNFKSPIDIPDELAVLLKAGGKNSQA
jgi:hypothetical protein